MINKRSAGILLPIFSLPSNYGIGTLGREAYKFIDFLVEAKQSYWQILPIGPTSYGDSPYSSFSSFAGNPYFIDLDYLVDDGLLTKDDLNELTTTNEKRVDYNYLYQTRFKILYKAYISGIVIYNDEYQLFCQSNINWLKDYSLFMALKQKFGMVSWQDWPLDVKLREPNIIERYQSELKDDIDFYSFIQYLFFKQYNNLKRYANENGIKIIGDLPIYVALDSCDVWANPQYFQLDKKNVPIEVAGVPPDYFSKNGQLWGNPLYNWSIMKQDGYKWWIERVDGAAKNYDVLRIDHFRGFESYWAVKKGNRTAKNGHWVKGPGIEFVNIIRNWFYNVEFIAEDLGILTDDVVKLVNDSQLPGMRVTQFGFNSDSSNAVFNHIPNSVAYVGTHDNSTIMGWLAKADKKEIEYAIEYFDIKDINEFNMAIIKGTMASCAKLFICQLQDYLGLNDEARINLPGSLGNNWCWRLEKKQYNSDLAKKICKITELYGRG